MARMLQRVASIFNRANWSAHCVSLPLHGVQEQSHVWDLEVAIVDDLVRATYDVIVLVLVLVAIVVLDGCNSNTQ